MTSSWTVRILAGLVAIALVVLGVSLISGGGDDGADEAASTVASNDGGTTTEFITFFAMPNQFLANTNRNTRNSVCCYKQLHYM